MNSAFTNNHRNNTNVSKPTLWYIINKLQAQRISMLIGFQWQLNFDFGQDTLSSFSAPL